MPSAFCGIICGADNWVESAEWGEAKAEWLRTVLELPNGIPAHDTVGDEVARIDSAEFQSCFAIWVQAVYELTDGQVIAIDGKTMGCRFALET